MPLKPYSELAKIDVEPYCKVRDNVKYLNWAKCVELLHQNGAEVVSFIPITNVNGSSLFMSDISFEDKNGISNRCYEVRIHVVIDNLEFDFQTPVMNGGNPVKNNSMSQQRVWNAQTRAFVKGVALHTGLGFNMWVQSEIVEDAIPEEDLSKHKILKIRERMLELITDKIKSGFTKGEIAEAAGMSEDELDAFFKVDFRRIHNVEARIRALKNDSQ